PGAELVVVVGAAVPLAAGPLVVGQDDVAGCLQRLGQLAIDRDGKAEGHSELPGQLAVAGVWPAPVCDGDGGEALAHSPLRDVEVPHVLEAVRRGGDEATLAHVRLDDLFVARCRKAVARHWRSVGGAREPGERGQRDPRDSSHHRCCLVRAPAWYRTVVGSRHRLVGARVARRGMRRLPPWYSVRRRPTRV